MSLNPRLLLPARRIAGLPRASLSANSTSPRGYATSSESTPCLTHLRPTHPDSSAPASTTSLIQDHSSYLLNTYARPPILFTHGKKCTLHSSSDQTYLDFTAGIAVTALGHSDDGLNAVMSEQAGKLSHISNAYWNEWAGALAKSLVELTREHGGLGLKTGGEAKGKGAKVFFTNSGTEANEGALKFARMYGKSPSASQGARSKTDPESKTGIVCFANAFHGRSLGALSVTPNPKYQGPFQPLIPGVRVGEYNDLDQGRMNALVDESTCGVIVEPIQGEGGVGTGKVEWLEMLARRCREVGAVLIFDEIQCGLFRSGTMWAHSTYPADAQPDIITMAKPLANGFPIGAIMVRDPIASAISVGSHGTTFGGQPLATKLGHYVLSRLSDPSFLSQLSETAAHLDTLLNRLPQLFPRLIKSAMRGRGLIRGIPFRDEKAPGELVRLARERGVLLLTAGKDAVRLVPPLVISKEECTRALEVVESCLHIMSEQGRSKGGTP